jgi:hypothetical protein
MTTHDGDVDDDGDNGDDEISGDVSAFCTPTFRILENKRVIAGF